MPNKLAWKPKFSIIYLDKIKVIIVGTKFEKKIYLVSERDLKAILIGYLRKIKGNDKLSMINAE